MEWLNEPNDELHQQWGLQVHNQGHYSIFFYLWLIIVFIFSFLPL